MYFIWGILKRPTLGQEDRIFPAEKFFKFLDDTDASILVPSPLLTELLMQSSPAEHQTIFDLLGERFFVGDYDTNAAKLAADIWNTKKRDAAIQDLIKTGGTSYRTKLKVDLQILAIAMSNHASMLYTNDGKFKKLAESYIVVNDMPEVSEQMDLMGWRPSPPSSPSASPPPSLQFPTVARKRVIEPVHDLPSAPQADQEQPPPDSSGGDSA
ncbi:MAG: hypothetical protein V4689_16410 [Verrucomicrobiota bacterium]